MAALQLIDEGNLLVWAKPNRGTQPEETRGKRVDVVWECDRHADRLVARNIPADPPTRWSITGQAFDIAFYRLAS